MTASEHLDDVIGDIADSYIPDPHTRRSMIEDLREAIAETVGCELERLRAELDRARPEVPV